MNTRDMGMYAGVGLAVLGLVYLMRQGALTSAGTAAGNVLAGLTDPFAAFTPQTFNPFTPIVPAPTAAAPVAVTPASPVPDTPFNPFLGTPDQGGE